MDQTGWPRRAINDTEITTKTITVIRAEHFVTNEGVEDR